jgi:membrane-associated phospholipid phosphatase
VLAVIAFVAFVVLAIVAHLGLFRSIDRELLTAIQSVARPELDLAGSIVTLFGQAEVTVGIAAGLVVARLRARRADFWVPLAIAVVVVVEVLGKIVVAQPLPPLELARGIALVPGVDDPFAHSFPSGHVARDAFLLAVINGWPRVVTVAAVAVVALSRVYMGEHWPSDVFGGLALGAAVAWAARPTMRAGREDDFRGAAGPH